MTICTATKGTRYSNCLACFTGWNSSGVFDATVTVLPLSCNLQSLLLEMFSQTFSVQTKHTYMEVIQEMKQEKSVQVFNNWFFITCKLFVSYISIDF